MTDEEIRREYFTKHDRYFALLRPQDQKDVIAGICVMSVSEGRPVLDYTGRWGEWPTRYRFARGSKITICKSCKALSFFASCVSRIPKGGSMQFCKKSGLVGFRIVSVSHADCRGWNLGFDEFRGRAGYFTSSGESLSLMVNRKSIATGTGTGYSPRAHPWEVLLPTPSQTPARSWDNPRAAMAVLYWLGVMLRCGLQIRTCVR
jgi:hypothetical protein